MLKFILNLVSPDDIPDAVSGNSSDDYSYVFVIFIVLCLIVILILSIYISSLKEKISKLEGNNNSNESNQQ